jgi:hypothetical protein
MENAWAGGGAYYYVFFGDALHCIIEINCATLLKINAEILASFDDKRAKPCFLFLETYWIPRRKLIEHGLK